MPLSPVLADDGRLWFATVLGSPTGRNLVVEPRVRVAFGPTRDVVLLDGTAELHGIAALPPEVLEAYLARHGSDPRTWADAAVAFTPARAQAWREENELRGRTIMREGRWLT